MVLHWVQLNKIPAPSTTPFGRWSPGHSRSVGRNPLSNHRCFVLLRVRRGWRELWLMGFAAQQEQGPGNALQHWLCSATCCDVFLIADNWGEYDPTREQMHAPKPEEYILALVCSLWEKIYSEAESGLRWCRDKHFLKLTQASPPTMWKRKS